MYYKLLLEVERIILVPILYARKHSVNAKCICLESIFKLCHENRIGNTINKQEQYIVQLIIHSEF